MPEFKSWSRFPRLGLCCLFVEHPVSFRTTTATAALKLTRRERFRKLSALCLENGRSLLAALEFCAANGIGAFRINSQIWPLKTHPKAGYRIDDLPDASAVEAAFRACGAFAMARGLRLSMHPDQFVILNSRKPEVVASSIAELTYQAQVADWTGADVLNIHGGGAYGDKPSALAALEQGIGALPDPVRRRLTLENDDRVYTPSDLLPVCRSTGVPLVYDVHHHRCLPDGLSEEEATRQAVKTWGKREPLFHLSSPRDGWDGPKPSRHHDYIDLRDFPATWRHLRCTVEVEAKAKEKAVLKLAAALAWKI
jgi:UV DNA damage endonuclease